MSGGKVKSIRSAYSEIEKSQLAFLITKDLQNGVKNPTEIANDFGSSTSSICQILSFLHTVNAVEKEPKEGRKQPYSLCNNYYFHLFNAHRTEYLRLENQTFFELVLSLIDERYREKIKQDIPPLIHKTTKQLVEDATHNPIFMDLFSDVGDHFCSGAGYLETEHDTHEWFIEFVDVASKYITGDREPSAFSTAYKVRHR